MHLKNSRKVTVVRAKLNRILVSDDTGWVMKRRLDHKDSGVYFPGSSAGKEFACDAGDPGSIPWLGRCLGEGKDYPLQYSGMENSMDSIVHGVTKSQTQLNDFHLLTL